MVETVDWVLNLETPLGPVRGRVNVEKGPMGLAYDLAQARMKERSIKVKRYVAGKNAIDGALG